jgi:ubiquinone/menaquinone biosynthesis C-methylase UbiE
MATEFPECHFLGIDIAPLQPTTVLPQNCSFELTNVLEGIRKPDNYFDYVHHRFLVGAIPANQWKQYIQECVRVCASDGWVEIVETDIQIVDGGSACQQLNTWLIKGGNTRGIDIDMVQHLDELMHEAGLNNVTKQTFTAPIGPWGGKVGKLFAEDYRLVSSSIQPFVTNALHVPKEDVEKNCALMLEEFESHQAYANIYVYLGQKQ